MRKIKVMVADDHSLIRKGLKQILELEEDIEVVGEAVDGRETVQKALQLVPDVILVDINMPVQNGISAIKELKKRGCPSRIIVLTIHEDREYLLEAVKAGAEGYIMKDAEADNLIQAIRFVYRGETYIQPNLSNEIIRDFDKIHHYSSIENKFKNNNLTRREMEVLMLIAEGKNNRQIAEELFISEKTVKNHVSNIFKKINVRDRTQAAIYALKNLKW